MRLFILTLSAACVALYGYALAGYAGNFFGRGRPDYVLWGLSAGTLCAGAAFYFWKKWLKDTTPDLLVFDADVLSQDGLPGIPGTWRELPLRAGLYTEKTRHKTEEALALWGWQDFPGNMIVCSDDGILKPSPKALEILCERSGAKYPVFFGDTASDCATQAAFGKGMFIAIGPVLKSEARRGDFLHFDTLEEALSSLFPS